jgi:DNA polymerase-1
MSIPIDIMTEIHNLFWSPEYFSGIKDWQNTLREFYKIHGYVETVTGRRRYAPIDSGEIINFPVQSFAADIMIDALCKLVEYALASNRLQYIPRVSIHDDLSTYLEIYKYKEDIEFIGKTMVSSKFDVINVPLTIECKTGYNWGELKEYKVFSSTDYA